ncbi:hypothetical protein JQC92_14380 [Shewanella sp. 202IG2-18]|uniref:hypothetical protein n=1 Tax=Parashewanella hymeniacidonis TaxID=2807618 RepID=UPI0019621371|nr:hypothetical protein [Parashewanella hymeniacidonis]MBM7073199.1 hypothetical protein [Parashewanella hymeniacidonis]
MKRLLLVGMLMITPFANSASFSTKVAAGFNAKFNYCAEILAKDKTKQGWQIKAGLSQLKADGIGSDYIGKKGFVKYVIKETKYLDKHWAKDDCKNFLKKHL